MTNKQIYDRLYHLIRLNPNTKTHPKKHGNWLKLDLWHGEFFSVDTWNSRILLMRGAGDYWGGYNGFTGDVIRHCGMDFGRFEYDGATEQLQHALALAEHAMAERATAHAPEVG